MRKLTLALVVVVLFAAPPANALSQHAATTRSLVLVAGERTPPPGFVDQVRQIILSLRLKVTAFPLPL